MLIKDEMFKLFYAICLILVAVELAMNCDMEVLFKAREMLSWRVDSLCYFFVIELSLLVVLLFKIVFILGVAPCIYLVLPSL